MQGPEDLRRETPAGSDSGLDILLVDDSDESWVVARTFLGRLGHRVRVAHNGARALEMLAHRPYDLVLMDIEMPGMDGLETTRRIRAGQAGERAATTPVVAMTAHVLNDHEETFLEAGMNDYMPKPMRMKNLRIVLDRVAGSGHGPDSGVGANASASAGPLERERILQSLEGNVALLDDLYAIFRRNAPGHLERLGRALHRGDTDAALQAVHSLKGNAATIGARDLSVRAALVYGKMREGDLAGAALEAAGLGDLMREVLRVLDGNDAQGGER